MQAVNLCQIASWCIYDQTTLQAPAGSSLKVEAYVAAIVSDLAATLLYQIFKPSKEKP